MIKCLLMLSPLSFLASTNSSIQMSFRAFWLIFCSLSYAAFTSSYSWSTEDLVIFTICLPSKGTPRVMHTSNAVTGNFCPSRSLKQTSYGSMLSTSHLENFFGIYFKSTFKKEANPIDLTTSVWGSLSCSTSDENECIVILVMNAFWYDLFSLAASSSNFKACSSWTIWRSYSELVIFNTTKSTPTLGWKSFNEALFLFRAAFTFDEWWPLLSPLSSLPHDWPLRIHKSNHFFWVQTVKKFDVKYGPFCIAAFDKLHILCDCLSVSAFFFTILGVFLVAFYSLLLFFSCPFPALFGEYLSPFPNCSGDFSFFAFLLRGLSALFLPDFLFSWPFSFSFSYAHSRERTSSLLLSSIFHFFLVLFFWGFRVGCRESFSFCGSFCDDLSPCPSSWPPFSRQLSFLHVF